MQAAAPRPGFLHDGSKRDCAAGKGTDVDANPGMLVTVQNRPFCVVRSKAMQGFSTTRKRRKYNGAQASGREETGGDDCVATNPGFISVGFMKGTNLLQAHCSELQASAYAPSIICKYEARLESNVDAIACSSCDAYSLRV